MAAFPNSFLSTGHTRSTRPVLHFLVQLVQGSVRLKKNVRQKPVMLRFPR